MSIIVKNVFNERGRIEGGVESHYVIKRHAIFTGPHQCSGYEINGIRNHDDAVLVAKAIVELTEHEWSVILHKTTHETVAVFRPEEEPGW